LLALLALVSVASGAIATAALADPNNNNSNKLRAAVTVAGIREHQLAFQAIADANGGIRTSGTPGYDASVAYVAEKLQAAGYAVTIQAFDFAYFAELSPSALSQIAPVPTVYTVDADFATMTYSGSGTATAPITPVDLVIPPGPTPSTSNSGCEAADFAGFPAGNIALLQRGTCTFDDKARNALAAGASGAIIFNEGQPGRTDVLFGTLSGPISIPVLGMSFALGESLYQQTLGGPVTLSMTTSTISELRPTANVLAETERGDAGNVVMVGAHLDSVEAGPGINDNGSGSATVLEIAEQMSKVKPRNKVRFAFWGAEEFNLLGSDHYVGGLSEAELDSIALYLNFDMVGSPNFVRFVYDGDGSATPAAGPEGSAQIEQVFLQYFAEQGLATAATAFDGRSDYGPFIAVGIPAGGLFSGAEGIKTPAEAAIYGGTAGIAYDPCYHQACDTAANVSETALDQLGDAAAHAVITLAQSTAVVNGERGHGGFNTFDQLGHQAAA
jgi:Zn-dependent M28 family amino/carboxypeptidase